MRQGRSAGRSDPALWGGTMFIVGIIALIAGLVYVVLGNVVMVETSLLVGIALLVAGSAVARIRR